LLLELRRPFLQGVWNRAHTLHHLAALRPHNLILVTLRVIR
jgi:hypothetical protein